MIRFIGENQFKKWVKERKTKEEINQRLDTFKVEYIDENDPLHQAVVKLWANQQQENVKMVDKTKFQFKLTRIWSSDKQLSNGSMYQETRMFITATKEISTYTEIAVTMDVAVQDSLDLGSLETGLTVFPRDISAVERYKAKKDGEYDVVDHDVDLAPHLVELMAEALPYVRAQVDAYFSVNAKE